MSTFIRPVTWDLNTAPTQRELDEGLDKTLLLQHLMLRLPEVLHYLLPNGREFGHEYKVGSVRGERGDSLCVELRGPKAGQFFDHATGEGGDLFALWAAVFKYDTRHDFVAILADIRDWLGHRFFSAAPEPSAPEKPILVLDELGPRVGEWIYTDRDGEEIGRVWRYHPVDPETGKVGKEFRPWDTRARKMRAPDPRPLYNQPGILAAQEVVIVEGESSAQALIDHGVCATTAMQGSKAPIEKTDWSPLRGKCVVIWPDNDQPGRAYAETVARAARATGAASVEILIPPMDMPAKWDAADAFTPKIDPRDGQPTSRAWTANEVRDFIRHGRGQEPHPQDTQQVQHLPRVRFHEIEPSLDTHDFVQDTLTKGAFSVAFGGSNVGKTFAVMDMAMHVALGRDWHGKRVEKGGVVYVAAEGGSGIKNRIEAFRQHHQITEAAPFTLVPTSVNLLDPEADTEPLIRLIKDEADALSMPVVLVVIDTLSRAMAGGNENASDDMGALVMNADRIRQETGAHVLLVHHAGKDTAKGARGHSLLRAATDTEIEITRADNALAGTIRVTKQRDLEIKEPLGYKLHVVTIGENRRGEAVTSCVVIPSDYSPPACNGKGKKQSQLDLHMQTLRNTLADKGAVVHSPKLASVPSVNIPDFYDALRSQGAIGATNRDAEMKQGQRIVAALRKAGLAATGAGRIWLAELAEQTPEAAGH